MGIVVCRTDGCANAGAEIDLPLTYEDDDGNEQSVDAVACGVCGQEITDVRAAG